MSEQEFYLEPEKKLPVKRYDVIVAGGGTAGLFAAISAARLGAKTLLVESKAYCGGIAVEGGTAIHSFYNLYTAFPGVEKRKVVKGIPEEFIDRLTEMGGCSGYPEMKAGRGYDSVCTVVDTELYKLLAFRMLKEAGVKITLNTIVTGVAIDDAHIGGVITESRSGREAFMAESFIDATGYGDLCAHAGAEYTIPNDYNSVNSFGLANASIDDYHALIELHGAIGQLCIGSRSGVNGKVIRVDAEGGKIPIFSDKAYQIGMSTVTTTVYDNYLMFVKCNYKIPGSIVNRDDVSLAEMDLRERMHKGAELFRKYIPGFEKSFIARTSSGLINRRGRLIICDYDITHMDVIDARHFDDDVFVYGFHDMAPTLQIKDGGTYGIPYRALRVKGVDNLYATGMMITSDHRAHMSTRNTVCCMGQGQAAGTAAAICAEMGHDSRSLSIDKLRETLMANNVYFE